MANRLTKIVQIFRAVLFYLASLLILVVVGFSAALTSPFLSKQKTQYLINRFSVMILVMCEWICGIRYELEGQENMLDGPCVILCNHQSMWETFLMQTLFFPLSSVLKKELLNVPFFGRGAKKLDAIALDRSLPAQSYKQLIYVGTERLDDKRSVLIFPEGTRVRNGERAKFSRGGASLAHHAQVPILPVAHNSGLRWPFANFVCTSGTIKVRIGAPIYPEGKSKRELYQLSTCWIERNRDELMTG